MLRAIAKSDSQPACLCRRRHFEHCCARLPARCSSSASPTVRYYHLLPRMQDSLDTRVSVQSLEPLPTRDHMACRAFNVPRQAGRAAFARQAVSRVRNWPDVHPLMQHSALGDEQHAAVLATVSQPDTNEPPAVNLIEQSRRISMQQPAAAEPAVVPGSSASAAPRPTVEVPAAAQPPVAAAMQADGGPVRSAVGSPGGQPWSDPLQTVCPPGHHPMLSSASQWCTHLHAFACHLSRNIKADHTDATGSVLEPER